VTTVDSVDAFSLLQNMAPMSYDSSRLVDVACIAYAHIDAASITALRQKFFATVEKQFQVRLPERAGTPGQPMCHQDGPALADVDQHITRYRPSQYCVREQDRFGKPLDAVRCMSDEEEGLAFNWAPAGMPEAQAAGEAGPGALSYLPLMGSIQPDAYVPSPDQLQCLEVTPPASFALPFQPSMRSPPVFFMGLLSQCLWHCRMCIRHSRSRLRSLKGRRQPLVAHAAVRAATAVSHRAASRLSAPGMPPQPGLILPLSLR
jgi:hypothetical protein